MHKAWARPGGSLIGEGGPPTAPAGGSDPLTPGLPFTIEDTIFLGHALHLEVKNAREEGEREHEISMGSELGFLSLFWGEVMKDERTEGRMFCFGL